MRWPWSKRAEELAGHRERADRAVQRADHLLQRAERSADQARVTARRAAAILEA